MAKAVSAAARVKLTRLTSSISKLVNADILNTELGGATLFGMGLKPDKQQSTKTK